MDNALGTTLAPIAQPKKVAARIAMVDLQDGSQTILAECFRQFGIEAVMVNENAAERLRKEKFEACVVKLGPAAQVVMEAARTSPSNSRMVPHLFRFRQWIRRFSVTFCGDCEARRC